MSLRCKLVELNRKLNYKRKEETELLKEISKFSDYAETMDILERIKNYFTLPPQEEREKDLNFFEKQIYKLRYNSALKESCGISESTKKTLQYLIEQGETGFNLENVLSIYTNELKTRKKKAIHNLGALVLGIISLIYMPFSPELAPSLAYKLYWIVFGLSEFYIFLSRERPGSIKSINSNISILTEKFADIYMESVGLGIKKQFLDNSTGLEKGNQPGKQLPYSFNGTTMGPRVGDDKKPTVSRRILKDDTSKK